MYAIYSSKLIILHKVFGDMIKTTLDFFSTLNIPIVHKLARFSLFTGHLSTVTTSCLIQANIYGQDNKIGE